MREGLSVRVRRGGALLAASLAFCTAATATAAAQEGELPTTDDPRVGLGAGFQDAETAELGMQLLGHANKAYSGATPGDFGFVNSDLAFQGDLAFVGNYNGFQIYNIANPSAPTLVKGVVCPGGQGDVSVHGNLVFMSVEENRARTDCTLNAASTPFKGVRIFDISNLEDIKQVAAVQTCRGSHTHTLVTDEDDASKVWVYVQGTGAVRSATQLAGCVETPGGSAALEVETPQPENSSRWRIEVIEVPVAAPAQAKVVTESRLFSDGARINGLQNQPPRNEAGQQLHPSGEPWSPRPVTDACHDITVYPALELAAGACEGNGLLIDISDPANPERLSATADENFAYWHGATFSNDGTKVIFTDEWGGGTAPKCRATDQLNWGANAVYEIVGDELVRRSYFKIPPVQTTQENCVSHLPSLVPVPGRDIIVQAWYQGGASVIDFTDAENPFEIGYFDRGPVSATVPLLAGSLGGFWSTYWYNGAAYGTEIARGFDALGLTPTEDLTANEIAAAQEVQVERLNVQHQDPITWAPSFNVTRAFIDQAVRSGDLSGKLLDRVNKFVDRAERFSSGPQARAAKANLKALSNQLPGEQFDNLRGSLVALSEA
jgi:hypothetical protein